MMKAMTSAIAGLKAHQTAMDVVGNNIANVNTYAFKSSDTSFRDTMYQTMKAAAGGDYAASMAGSNPMQVGFGASATGVTVDTTAGSQDATGRPTDCYISGEGYFIVQDGVDTSTGVPSSYKYTRVGELQFDSQGFLTDGNGNYILGANNSAVDATTDNAKGAIPTGTHTDDTDKGYLYAGTTGTGEIGTDGKIAALQRISYDTTDAKNSLSDIKISSDGTITAVNTDKKVVTIGRIALAYFNNPAGLDEAGGSYYKSNAGSGNATVFATGEGATGMLNTGMLEGSNVDLATQLSNMIVYERGYQANTKIISVADEMLQTLVNMK